MTAAAASARLMRILARALTAILAIEVAICLYVPDVWRLPLALRSVADLGGVVAYSFHPGDPPRARRGIAVLAGCDPSRRVGCRAAAGWATREPSDCDGAGRADALGCDRRGCGRRNHRLQSRPLAGVHRGLGRRRRGLRIHPRCPVTDAEHHPFRRRVSRGGSVGIDRTAGRAGRMGGRLGVDRDRSRMPAASPIAHAVHVRANHPQRRRLLLVHRYPAGTARRASSATLPSFAATGRSTRTATCRVS